MRTTLDLPRGLVEEAKRLSGARTKTQAIVLALQELIRRKKMEGLLDLMGKFPDFDPDLKSSRSR